MGGGGMTQSPDTCVVCCAPFFFLLTCLIELLDAIRRNCTRNSHSSAYGEAATNRRDDSMIPEVGTTERYLGCKQRFREAVNDRLGIEPVA